MTESNKSGHRQFIEQFCPDLLRDIQAASETGRQRGVAAKAKAPAGARDERPPEGKPQSEERIAGGIPALWCLCCNGRVAVGSPDVVWAVCEKCCEQGVPEWLPMIAHRAAWHAFAFAEREHAAILKPKNALLNSQNELITALREAFVKSRNETKAQAILLKAKDDALAETYAQRGYFSRWCVRWFLAALAGWACWAVALLLS